MKCKKCKDHRQGGHDFNKLEMTAISANSIRTFDYSVVHEQFAVTKCYRQHFKHWIIKLKVSWYSNIKTTLMHSRPRLITACAVDDLQTTICRNYNCFTKDRNSVYCFLVAIQ